MANFTPSGTIRIGRVPFDNSYSNTVVKGWGNAASQASDFSGRMTASLTKDTYTYVRMNNTIRVNFNAEELYTYNYVMYQNSNYGSKWFYAFIIGCNYINENCTELVLQLDVIQTWWFELNLRECFVEREHVNSDKIGEHINPEPSMMLEYDAGYVDEVVMDSTSRRWVILLITSFPAFEQAGLNFGGYNYPVTGANYNEMYNPCRFLAYEVTTESVAAMRRTIQRFSKNGIGDAIVDSFMVSEPFFTENDFETFSLSDGYNPDSKWKVDEYALQFKTGIPTQWRDKVLTEPTSLDGHIPRNNKLYTAPYCYAEVGDYAGNTKQYRWEWGDVPDSGMPQLKFSYAAPINTQTTAIVKPIEYNGLTTDDNPIEIFTADVSTKMPWLYDSYSNWLAQNSLNNAIQIGGGVGSALLGAGMGIGAATKALSAANAASRVSPILDSAGKNIIKPKSTYLTSQEQFGVAQEAASGYNNQITAGLGSALNAVQNIYQMSFVPNSPRGNINGNSRFQSGYCGFYFQRKYLLKEFAEIVDDFFDAFGYQVDSLKTPNVFGRPCWNYVKTTNSNHYGDIPANDLSMINGIFNNGITFWHDWDVGDYNRSNAIS